MKATFENSVNVLVKAYLDGSLIPLDCTACAVGQLLGGNKSWSSLFTCTQRIYTDDQILNSDGIFHSKRKGIPESYSSVIEKEVKILSGYEWHELSRVEFAFVSTTKGLDSDDIIFDGLMAVVDVLADIHNIDLTERISELSDFASQESKIAVSEFKEKLKQALQYKAIEKLTSKTIRRKVYVFERLDLKEIVYLIDKL